MEDDDRSGRATTPADGASIEPPEWFVEQANVRDQSIYERFESEWPDCWAQAGDLLDWEQPYDDVFRGDDWPPFEWFPGGELNGAYNCVDRHLPERKNQLALIWEGQHGESRTYTYLELYREVNAVAAALSDLGVRADDVVTTYLPMVPELPVAMLACARIGAVHNVVFAGFSADALASRMDRAGSSVLVTCDGYYRRGSAVDQKRKADNARFASDADVTAVVVDRLGADIHLGPDHHDYDELREGQAGAEVEPIARSADDRLFRIYTSGTTGQPKAVDHVTGGYLAQVAWTSRAVLDVKPEDTYWCSADIGWITGHSYIVYGPLALGTTSLLYEGTADHPQKDRMWEIVERNAVDIFYTAPTAVRAFMKWGEEYPARRDLSSLRLLGTVGEPINPRAWEWYREHIGGGECPVVDTWWQTETGAILVGTSPARTLVDAGVRVREATAEGGATRLVAETGSAADAREVVTAVTEAFPGTRLLAKRETERSVETTAGFREQVGDSLTDKQRTALEAAYHGGYFEWPRESTAEELAASLDVASPTLHNHLRIAQQKVLAALLEHQRG